MMPSRSERVVSYLKSLQVSNADIEASAMVGRDGQVIASSLPAEVEEDRVSAMSAAMLSLGERMGQELQRGHLEQVFIRGSLGCVIVVPVGEEAVLTTLARSEAKLGPIFWAIRQAAHDLERLLASG